MYYKIIIKKRSVTYPTTYRIATVEQFNKQLIQWHSDPNIFDIEWTKHSGDIDG